LLSLNYLALLIFFILALIFCWFRVRCCHSLTWWAGHSDKSRSTLVCGVRSA